MDRTHEDTRQRLEHALARLSSEPRSNERRRLERRQEVPAPQRALLGWIVPEDRRNGDERRKKDRRSA